MGKTKTAFVSEVGGTSEKSSEEKYKEKKVRQEAQKKEHEKIHISGLKGGQRVRMVSTEEPVGAPSPETEEKPKTKSVKTRGQKYQGAKAKIKPGEKYKTGDAIKLIKETSYSKFDGTMEMHLVVKKTGTNIQVTLPYSTGKAKKVEVASEATIKNLERGKADFDILLALPDMMPKLVPFARILGPKGLMPNPKNGTIIKSAKEAEKFGGNSLALKTEKDAPLMHTTVGKVSQADSEIAGNIEAILKALGGEKTVVRAYLKSTMSPSVRLQLA